MHFFFYGTLMSGFYNNNFLTKLPGSKKLFDATVRGYKLWGTGRIPIAVKSNDRDELTHGEVWEVSNPYAVAALHQMEVRAGYKAVEVTAANVPEAEYMEGVYMYVHDEQHVLGDWMKPIPNNNYREWRK